MEVKTKFNIGDTVSVIEGNKIVDIVISYIEINRDGVKYRSENYGRYNEDVCFASREAIFDYILGNTNKSETSKSEEK